MQGMKEAQVGVTPSVSDIFCGQGIRGVGLGLRACHYQTILTGLPSVPWFEVLTENYLGKGGLATHYLSRIREHYPITFHGVSLSLGSTDPLNRDYLQQLERLIAKFQPAYISDHLSWSSFSGQYFHELLPLPYTEEAVTHVAGRIRQVQDYLGQQLLIENVSSYMTFVESSMPEWEFLQAVADRADCFILLDINNLYVNAINHSFNPQDYLNYLNITRIKQMHLSGFRDCHTHLLDSHDSGVAPPVWNLFADALQRLGEIPVAIEWDNAIPEFSELLAIASQAEKQYANQYKS